MSRLVLAAVAAAVLPSLVCAQTPVISREPPIRPVMTTPFPGYTYGYLGGVVGGDAGSLFADPTGRAFAAPYAFYAYPRPGGFITANGKYVPYGVEQTIPGWLAYDVNPNGRIPSSAIVGQTVVDVSPTGGFRPVGPGPIGQAVAAPEPVAPAYEFPAVLTLEFPTAAQVWLDGVAVGEDDANRLRPELVSAAAGGEATTRTLTSPVLKPGQQHTFKVKARWTVDGKTYETTREVTLGAGDRSKLLVLSGTPVAGSGER
jgi:uncharacterized protein (TIGR03000 family)